MKHYFKQYWNETTGEDISDSWGTSTYYFETDGDMNVIRQIQVFENDQVLKYDQGHSEDEYGMLSDQQLNNDAFFEIDANQFMNIWAKTNQQHNKK